MDTARWARVRSILERAIDASGPELESQLARDCGEDAELRREVESLLGFDARGKNLEPPAPSDVASVLVDPNLDRRIGPYTIEKLIGAGGMGVVYLARRADADFEQRVALKLIKRGMDSDDILRQFRRERAVLAGLDHKNIARLFDGGATDDGLPWFAMEFVEGRPIDQWCAQHAPSTRARIELFIKVCAAVRHAHQRLIVHRDLKPSNILVLEDGTPKLLDFGIAKVLAVDGAEATANTQANQRRLTPDYASPEQLRGEGVSTATDVYSLGVILYELLSGESPFHGVPGTERAVPPRPSTRLRAAASERGAAKARKQKDLRGDLDTITLTALAPETGERYASVEALELDLRRHLDGLPIEARPATAAYRARKFVGRNKIAVSAAIAVFASLVIGLLFARSGTLEAVRQTAVAEKRRILAEKEAKRANSVLKLTREMLGRASPEDVKSKNYTLRELLDDFDTRLDSEPASDPEVEASVRQIMGRAYRELGMVDKAKRHLDRALELLPDALVSDDDTSFALACEWLDLLHDQGEFARAESECTKLIERSRGVEPAGRAAIRLLGSRGDYRMHLGRLDEAEGDLRAALAGWKGDRSASCFDVVNCMGMLATVLERQNSFAAAQALDTEALELARKQLGDRSELTSTVLNNLGHLELRMGLLAHAEELLRESLSIERELHDAGQPGLAPILANLGRVLTARGNYDEAETALKEAIEIWRKAFGDRHPSLAADLGSLGTVLQAKGDYAGAENAMRESLEIRLAVYGEDNLDVARAWNNLGLLLRYRGKNEESEALLRKALAVRRSRLGERDVAVGATLSNLTGSLLGRDDLAGAEATAREAVSIYREVTGPASAELATVIATLAGVRLRQGDFTEARALAEESLAMRRQLFGLEHPDVARALSALGEVLLGAGEFASAEAQLREALAMQRKLIGPAHPNLARTLFFLGDLEQRNGKSSEAQALMREALAIRRKALGDSNGDTRDAAGHLAKMLEASGDAAGARDLRQELGLSQAPTGVEH